MRQGCVVWLTGLSASGKTTLAMALSEQLRGQGIPVEVLDGDEVRQWLSADLGFSAQDRQEHNRRVIYVSQRLMRNGVTVIVALISPYRTTRQLARAELGHFIEVYVKCPLEECLRRDGKGLYAKALRGEIADFTGISAPYEEPQHPEVTVETNLLPPERCVERILACLAERGYLAGGSPRRKAG